jgi:hypothetical protein
VDGLVAADLQAGDGGAGEESEVDCWTVPLGFKEEVEAQRGGGVDEGVPGFGDVAEGQDVFCWEVVEGVFEKFGG